jgi:hypothetical protein
MNWFNRIEHKLDLLLTEIRMTNQAVLDLDAAVAAIQTAITGAVSTLNALAAALAAGNPIAPSDIESQVTALNAAAAALTAATTADAPPASPPPVATT